VRGLKRLRVHPERLPVLREQPRRAVRDGRVELPARRLIGERVERPAAAHDPRRFGPRLGPRGETRLHLVQRIGAVQPHAVARESAGDQRRMRVVEPREHGAAMRVDDGRLRAAVAHHLALAADLEDLVAADRDRLRRRAEVVGGVDLRVVDDQIDRAAAVVALRPDDQASDERRPDDDGHQEGGKTRGHVLRADSITRSRPLGDNGGAAGSPVVSHGLPDLRHRHGSAGLGVYALSHAISVVVRLHG
jgi:hypothetical protein